MGERRRRPRARKRLGCEIELGERSYFGIATNISTRGLFIQTSARVAPLAKLEITLGERGSELSFRLRGRVARVFLAPPELASIVRSGIGVALMDPPADYLGFVGALIRSGHAGPAAARAELAKSFEYRVELEREGGGERRTLLVSCRSEAEAVAFALAELEPGWKVLSAERM